MGEIRQGLLVGGHNGDGARVLVVAVDQNVVDVGAAAVDGLELLERDVLAAEHLNEVLDAIDHFDVPVGVDLPDISCPEPAILRKRLSRLLRVLEVLPRHGLAA